MDNGIQYEQHEMILSQKYSTGAQEFYCPTCGRRFVMQWPPVYKRIVLEKGDENAAHSGGTVGISMNVTDVPAESNEDSTDQTGRMDDPYLSLWTKYLDDDVEL